MIYFKQKQSSSTVHFIVQKNRRTQHKLIQVKREQNIV